MASSPCLHVHIQGFTLWLISHPFWNAMFLGDIAHLSLINHNTELNHIYVACYTLLRYIVSTSTLSPLISQEPSEYKWAPSVVVLLHVDTCLGSLSSHIYHGLL